MTAEDRPRMEGQSLLEPEDVQRRVGVSRRTLDRWERQGRFPRKVRLSAGVVRWVESEVQEWIEQQMQKRGEE